MASKYWIKLYHEILEDPKMGTLPDNLWRRAIELFLMAGELDEDGKLPSTADIAWKLRSDVVTIRDELSRLCVTNILTACHDDTWIVTNFARRQAAVTDKERKQRQREREKRPKYQKQAEIEQKTSQSGSNSSHQSVTNRDTDTDTDTDINKTPIRPGEVGTRVLEICRLDYAYVETDEKLRAVMVNTFKYLAAKNVTTAQVLEFEEWRKSNHWTRASPPTLKQVAEYWTQYEDWVTAGRPAPQLKTNGGTNGQYKPDEQRKIPGDITGPAQTGIAPGRVAKIARLTS